MTTPSDKQRLESDATAPVSGVLVADTIVESTSPEYGDVISGDYQELPLVEPSDYVIGSEIARGGMGRILEGRDRRIGRNVALKEILIELLKIYPPAERDMLLRRFEREARITARLEHPAIVPVYEIGQMKGAPFFAMKKVEGRPLDELIDKAPSLAERLRLLPNVIAIADALGYAHTRGVVHRDLKPANVLIGEHGETVVIDWGLAKQIEAVEDEDMADAPVLDSDDGLRTVAGSVFGTPLYMPPEQARGETVDRRADVYSLGSILYHLLAGKPPYVESDQTDRKKILERLRREPPPPLAANSEDIPPDLASIVEKAMSRDPEARYPSAVELASDLRKFEAGQLVLVHRYSVTELLRRWVRRHRGAVATAAIALLALMIGGGVLVQKLRTARDGAMEYAGLAQQRQREATQLFAELGRAALHRDELVEATFAIVQAGLLGSKAPGLDVLMWEISQGMARVITRLDGGRATTARFSGDGKRVLVAFESGEMKILDAQTGAEQVSLSGPARLSRVQTDDSLSLIAALGGDKTVQLWDVEQRKVLRSITCNSKHDVSNGPLVSLSYDGTKMAVGCAFQGITLSEPRTGKKLGQLPIALPEVLGVFSANNRRILVTLPGAVVRLYDLRTGTLITQTQMGLSSSTKSVSGDFSKAAAIDKGKLIIFDLETDKATKIDTCRDVNISVLSLAGDVLLCASTDGIVSRHDTTSGRLERKWRAHRSPLQTLQMSRDGRIAASVGHDLVVRVWDTQSGRRLSSTIGVGSGAFVTLSPDGSRLLVGDHDGGLLINSGADEMKTLLTSERSWIHYGASDVLRVEGASRAALHQAGKSVEFAKAAESIGPSTHTSGGLFNRDGSLTVGSEGVIDTQTLAIVSPRPKGIPTPTQVAMSQDGKTVAMTSAIGISVWDVETGIIGLTVPLERVNAIIGIGVSAKAERLAIEVYGELLFVDTKTAEIETTRLTTAMRMVSSNNGERLLTFSPHRTTLWNFVTGEPIATLPGAFQAALSSDARHVVVQHDLRREMLSLYDARTGELQRTLYNDKAALKPKIISANAGLVVAADWSGRVRIWDADSGRMLLQRQLPSAPHSLAISPNGTEVAFAIDGSVLLFPIGRASGSFESLLNRLRALYTPRFFDDNFLLVR